MILKDLFETYDFDDIMEIVVDMFPGTTKYNKQLKQAYDMLLQVEPIDSKESIRYKIIESDDNEESYMGADDDCFENTWDVCMGKEIIREKNVDLTDIEITANSLICLCFISKYPKEFQELHNQLLKG